MRNWSKSKCLAAGFAMAIPFVGFSEHANAQMKRNQTRPTASRSPETREPGNRDQGHAQPLSGSNSATQVSVSRDLLDIYQATLQLSQESEFSSLIEQTTKISRDPNRHETDKEYARQLLAWGANKRGEFRSDRAGEFANAGDTDKAAEWDRKAFDDFQLALRNDPKKWKARHNLGIIYAMQAKRDLAISQFTEVISQNPKYANAYFNRGELYAILGESELAIADYTSAIQLNPQDSGAFASRARVKMQLNEWEQAVADYRKGLQLDPSNVELKTDYADACQSMQRWQESLNLYQTVLQSDPQNARVLQNIAWLQATCPDPKYRDAKKAMEMIQRAMASSTEVDYQLLDVRAAALACSGDFGKAAQDAKRAIEDAPEVERKEIEERWRLYRQNRAYLQVARKGKAGKESDEARSASVPVGTGVR